MEGVGGRTVSLVSSLFVVKLYCQNSPTTARVVVSSGVFLFSCDSCVRTVLVWLSMFGSRNSRVHFFVSHGSGAYHDVYDEHR